MKYMCLKKELLLPLSLVAGLLVIPSLVQATGILGGNLIVQNEGSVTVTFGGSEAGYTSTLYLGGTDTAIFSTNSLAGSTFSLGDFTAGTELSFRLEVQNTGNVFFTGAGANNIDGIAHAMVESVSSGTLQVGFEDLLGGGDKDYNDLLFLFSNTTTEKTIVQGQILDGSKNEDEAIGLPSLLSEEDPLHEEDSEDFTIQDPEPSSLYSEEDLAYSGGATIQNSGSSSLVSGENFGYSEGGAIIQNPEPSTIVLLGSGLLGLGAWRLRKKQE